MATHGTGRQGASIPLRRRVSDAQRLANGLGWFSLGLGIAGFAAPRLLARAAGIPRTTPGPLMLRLVGLREIASGLGILSQRRPTGWLWARVAGDLMDVALLGSAARSRRSRPNRIAMVATAVAGVTALDVLAARQLSGQAGTSALPANGHAVALRRTITVIAPPEQLYRFWRDFTNLPRFMSRLDSVQATGERRRSHWRARGPGGMVVEWDAEVVDDRPNELIAWRSLPGARVDHAGTVRFTPAPRGRGTEVAVEMAYTPPGGTLGATVSRLLGQAPEQQLQEDLRRFKQLMEAGEVMVSTGVPAGGRR